MNKIEEIFKAWGIMFNPSDEQSELGADGQVRISSLIGE